MMHAITMIMLARPLSTIQSLFPLARDVFNALKSPLNAPDPTMAYVGQVDP